MTEITTEQLLAIRQHAVNVALEVARISRNPDGSPGNEKGLIANAMGVEQFILTGGIAAPPAVSAPAAVRATPVPAKRTAPAKSTPPKRNRGNAK